MPAPRRVLVNFAHPALDRSRVNRRLFDAARRVEGVTTRDLYDLYPGFSIDVQAEQAVLAEHDVLVFQHPFYWYSMPSLLKEWQDLVLELGWAYGAGGTALRGKTVLHVITTGGTAEAYRAEGRNRFTIRHLVAPLDQTAHLCGMRFLAPMAIHGALGLSSDDAVAPHASRYVRALEGLRDGTLDLERAERADDLAHVLDQPSEGTGAFR
jgi:glutathione-regulated potassium-efflux system ancillary protein KefG